jgi:hypothetical protein
VILLLLRCCRLAQALQLQPQLRIFIHQPRDFNVFRRENLEEDAGERMRLIAKGLGKWVL